jgi:hypothetical protein
MSQVPWLTSSAIQWKADPLVFFGTLQQCCEKFEGANPADRDGARILCNAPIEINGEKWGTHTIAGQHLLLLLALLKIRTEA